MSETENRYLIRVIYGEETDETEAATAAEACDAALDLFFDIAEEDEDRAEVLRREPDGSLTRLLWLQGTHEGGYLDDEKDPDHQAAQEAYWTFLEA